MDRKELMALFNKQPRLGTMATSDGKGAVNNAVFSALNMIDEETVVMAIGDNRSYRNLKASPKATFLFFEPAPDPKEWKGARLYFEVAAMAENGPLYDHLVAEVRKMAGDQAADNIKAAVTFKIAEVRLVID